MTARNTILQQYGALPFAITDEGEVKVLLVTTRRRRGRIIPKGWPARNLTAAGTGEREACEEARVVGTIIGDESVGSYRYEKGGTSHRETIYEVWVFLFAVERQLRKWPERSERETRWFAPGEASKQVVPTGLANILLTTAWQTLVGRSRAKRSPELRV